MILKGQNFVCLESVKERGKCVGVLPDGSLKPALACSASDDHAKFGVHLTVRICKKYVEDIQWFLVEYGIVSRVRQDFLH